MKMGCVPLSTVALAAFGYDLYHFSHHLHHELDLLGLPAVWVKLGWKITCVLVSLGLFLYSCRPLSRPRGL